MRKLLVVVSVLFVLIFSSITYGDIGPKPSVVVDFKGIEGEQYFVTLLSSIPDVGPYYVVDVRQENLKINESDEEYEIWRKFVDYKDTDQYYFLQYMNDCSETNRFSWTYYPPKKFKVLIYFPNLDSFIVSNEIIEKYGFDSYFTAEVNLNGEGSIEIKKSYNYFTECISLIIRIVLTILIELLIAVLFALRHKKVFKFIVIVNIITQTLLNLILNIANYKYGGLAFVLNYIWLEVLVIAIEAKAYHYLINQKNSDLGIKKYIAPTYAIVANIVSFVVGFYLAYYIPGVF